VHGQGKHLSGSDGTKITRIQTSRNGLRSLPALLRGASIVQAQGRSDERKMGECLREIAELPLRLRIIFLSEQADIVAVGGQRDRCSLSGASNGAGA
jgi:hypothetical protein